MSAGDRGTARPDGGAGRQLGSRAAAKVIPFALALFFAGPAWAEATGCRLVADQAPPISALNTLRLCRTFEAEAPAAQFTIEIAATEAERARGLMERVSMPDDHGMLFVYPNPRPVAFWMHDTLIPLDMLFIDAQGMVVRIAENARPLDETPIPSGVPVRYVLEINGGMAAKLGLRAGQVVPELAALAQ